jgi:DNA-binding transcriptional MerR regulator
MAPALRIGQLARATGVSAKAIRYYEQVGVLPSPSRTAAGYRQYPPRGVHRVLFVRRARALGLSLRDLKALTAALDDGSRPTLRPRLLGLLREHLSAVKRRRVELRLLQRELERVLQGLLTRPAANGGDGCRCLETDGLPARPAPSHRRRDG